jgi:intermembrane space import and assembly protein 40
LSLLQHKPLYAKRRLADKQCLGGMADGPCGEDFKAAFSCFVYSEAEPKGMDCVEKFKAMQDCFRLHPEIYGEGMYSFHILRNHILILNRDRR